MQKIFMVIAFMLLSGTPSLACLNDSDLVKSENEFKSTYLHPAGSGGSREFPFAIVAVTVGLAAMVGAAFILPRSPRR